MNGTVPDIQVLKPFNEAIELTKKILFRPFDLKKWFVIGFAAWLSHIGGGGGANFNPGSNWRSSFRHIPGLGDMRDAIHRTPTPTLIIVIIIVVLLFLCLLAVFAWLRARGRLMFTDCVVRDRAAIAEPWREFRTLGNSFFLFSLLVGLGFFIVAILLGLAFLPWVGRDHHHLNALAVSIIVAWAGVIFVLAIAWALIAHLMVPIMFRRRCRAGEAFRAAISLISNYPGEITLYCLFWIVLAIGVAIVACLATCLTCCVAALPYIGTVILLPIYVCMRAFGLLFLRQFGPDYDVWVGLPQVETGVTGPGLNSGPAEGSPTEPSPPTPTPPPPPPPSTPPEAPPLPPLA